MRAAVPFTPLAKVADVFRRLVSQKFMPARRACELTSRRITWRRFPRFCDSRSVVHPFALYSVAPVDSGCHNGVHAKGRKKRKRGKERERRRRRARVRDGKAPVWKERKKYVERKGNETSLVHPLWAPDRYSGARG